MKGAENISLFVMCGDGAKHGHAPWWYNHKRIACDRARFPRVVGMTPLGACARDVARSAMRAFKFNRHCACRGNAPTANTGTSTIVLLAPT